MKKIIITIFLCFTQISFSQLIIETEISNGLYFVPCKVNEIPMNFIFDTGASRVTISENLALKLVKNGTIKNKDIIGTSNYQTASGDIKKGTDIILKSIKIKNLELKDVRATVIHNSNAPLVLGQNVLSKLGKITIEKNKLTIHNINKTISDFGFHDIIPFKIGMDRFDISIIESKDKSFTKNSKFSNLNNHEQNALDEILDAVHQELEMEFIPYLNKKVKKNVVNLYKSHSNRLNTKEVRYQLYLVNDYLYKINIYLKNNDINQTLDDYNFLIGIVPQNYIYTSSSTLKDSHTGSKIGEGVSFYKLPKEKLIKRKVDEINVTYLIKYEKYYDKNENRYRTNNKIKYFRTSIQIVNLHNTVLTNEGY